MCISAFSALNYLTPLLYSVYLHPGSPACALMDTHNVPPQPQPAAETDGCTYVVLNILRVI